MGPKLALAYNSDRGNGWIGVGWELEGLGSIERSTKKGGPAYTSDGTYTLTLSGASHELVYNANTGDYHTQIETFLRIRYDTAANYWVVTNKSGVQYRFGYNTDSRAAAIRLGSGTRAWMLDRVSNTHCAAPPCDVTTNPGNYMDITYIQDTVNGDVYPATITYTKGNGLTAFRTVTFITEPRTDFVASYRSGAKAIMDQRLKQIDISLNGAPFRSYALSYSSSPASGRSLLVEVSEIGPDGSRLPPTHFQYQPDRVGLPFQPNIVVNGNPASEADVGEVTMADLDGDGKADLTWRTGPCSYRYADINAGSVGESVSMEGDCLVYTPSGFSDLNGDSLPDLLLTHDPTPFLNTHIDKLRYALNIRGRWGEVQTSNLDVPYGDVSMIDLTGDGLADYISASRSGTNLHWRYARNMGGGNFAFPSHIATTPDNGSSSPAIFADINGDDLPDLVYRDNTYKWFYYPNNGDLYDPFETVIEIPTLFLNSKVGHDTTDVAYSTSFSSYKFSDMNGDGLKDLFWKERVIWVKPGSEWVPGGKRVGDDYWYYAPNLGPDGSGSVSFGPGVYLGINNYSPFLSRNESTFLADVTKDDRGDIVHWLKSGSITVYLAPSQPALSNRLTAITTPLGGTITLSYTFFGGVTFNMPFPKWVVSAITQSDGLGHTSITKFSYGGGKYIGYPTNEFRGFAIVTVTDPPDQSGKERSTATNFYQDDALKGQIKEREAWERILGPFQPQPTRLTRESFNYATSTPVAGVTRVDLTEHSLFTYNGTTAGAGVVTRYANHDSYGNPREVITSGNNIATRVTTTDFAYNTTAYIVNKPSRTEIRVDSNSSLFPNPKTAESWFDYDGQANGAAPTRGDLTKETRWLWGGPNPVVQHFYDPFGNHTGTIDARGSTCAATGLTVKIDYDATYQTFPVTETNALCQAVTKTYWEVNTPLSAAGIPGAYALPGFLATITDLNGVRTDSYWDGLGRPKATVIPPDTAAAPTMIWGYSIPGAPPNMTMQSKRESVGGGTLDDVTYLDGLGRTIQTKVEAETAGEWITVDTGYNPRGLTESVSVPYLTTGSAYTTPAAQPKTTTLYDPLGRPVRVTNPDGTFRTTAYDYLSVTKTDEKGFATTRTYDALKRLIKVEEPAGGGTTTFTYDVIDNDSNDIHWMTDAQGNSSATTFDTLGRKIRQYDPDLAFQVFTYDPNGNLLTQQGSENSIFTYDKLNRVTRKVTGPPDNTPPIISAVASGNISATAATINWTTDEVSDSQVEYGTSTTYGGSTPVDNNLVASHGVALSGLSSATLYHYRVKSKDALGNLAISGDFTFTTSAPPDTVPPTAPSNLTATVSSSTQINLTWTASTDNMGVTGYRVERCQGASCTNFAQIATPTETSFNNTGLTAGTTYRYRVRAADAAGNLSAYSNVISTTTTASDTTPPTISSVASGSITSSGATITWTTNEASDTQVEYGTTTSYGSSTTLNTVKVTSHSATLSGLSASTLYHYRVKSRDAAGNLATSGDFTFTTASSSGGPDLTMLTVGATVSGSNLTISDVVRNQGSVNAGAFNIGFYLSADTTYQATDPFLCQRSLTGLAAATSNPTSGTATTTCSISTVAPGLYYVIGRADSGASVTETNETNNTRPSSQIAIGPDLIVSLISASKSSNTLTISNAVKNQGNATAGASEISFYLSTDQTLSTASDTFVCKRSVASLTAGASNPTSGTTATVCTIPAVAAGSYYVIGYADSGGAVVEARENNNTQTGALITVP
jgi:hypothetical protein